MTLILVNTKQNTIKSKRVISRISVKSGRGAQGPQGIAATVNVGDTTTVTPGTPANVTNSGTENDAILDFEIPQGIQGIQGPVGEGVPAGGADNAVLRKQSASDFDTNWEVLSKADVGLANVDNTSDANKPVSTAQAAANTLDRARANHTGTQLSSTISDFNTAASTAAPVQSVAGKTGAVTLVKADVGLSNVDNTSDANKPVSSATTTALNLKAPLNSPAFTGTPTGITKAHVGLANVDNTSDAAKPVSTATATALNLKEDKANKGVPSGYASLGADGKLVPTQLPSLPIVDTYVVASQAAMLALTQADQGDVAIRTDLNKSFILSNNSPTVLANWKELLSPTDAVSSVNGRVGAVTGLAEQSDLTAHTTNTSNPHSTTKAQVGLGSVDNTSDAAKPVSTATASAIALKENLANKSTTTTLGTSDTLYPSQNAVKSYVDTAVSGVPLGNYVLKSGDTMTGKLSVTAASGVIPLEVVQSALNNTGSGLSVSNNGQTSSARLYVEGNTATSAFNIKGNAVSSANIILNNGGAGMVGIGITPTHTLTLPSTATGIASYNTVDQTTNYERVRQFWTGNIYSIQTELGGTGSARALRLSTFSGGIYAQINADVSLGMLQVGGTTSNTSAKGLLANPVFTSSSGITNGASISPTITQTGTAGYTTLLVNPTETTVGSGAKLLADFQVGGVSKASITNLGKFQATASTASGSSLNIPSGVAPTTPNDGDIWFDGTNLKIRIAGVTKTFTLT